MNNYLLSLLSATSHFVNLFCKQLLSTLLENLETLKCSNNELPSLPALPQNLKELDYKL